MTLESSGRCEFTEFMSNHILCYIHGDMLASVMNSEGVADKFGKDCGAAAPGLENLLVAGLVHLHDSLEQFRLHERSFFNASAHYFCSFLDLLAVAALHDKLIGGLLGVSRLIAECGLAPRSAGTGSADRALALTAAVRVVVRVHDGAADGGSPTEVTVAACLTDLNILVVNVADLTDCCHAGGGNVSQLARGQTKKGVCAFLSHELCGVARNTASYNRPDLKIGLTGSIAYYYKDLIADTAKELGLHLGTITKSPIEGLKTFHHDRT